MLPQDLHFHIHLSRNHRRPKKVADLLNSVYQLSTAAMYQFTSAADNADLLRSINRFLKAGVSIEGQIHPTTRSVPQGGPLSPVLANAVLDELDWELDRRGHCFARYADDCNILVKSKRAGERVMASVTRFVSD